MSALDRDDEGVGLLRVDERDGEVGEPEQLVDGVRRALQQVVEAEVGADQARHAGYERHSLAPLALVLVPAGVGDGDRRRPGEGRQRLRLLETERLGAAAHAEEPDHPAVPLDRHPDDGMVAEGGLRGMRQVAVPGEHHRRPALEHHARQSHTPGHLGADLARRHVVAGGRADQVALVVHQPDGPVLGADQLAGMPEDPLEQRLELQLAADGFDDGAHALLLPQQPAKLAGVRLGRGASTMSFGMCFDLGIRPHPPQGRCGGARGMPRVRLGRTR